MDYFSNNDRIASGGRRSSSTPCSSRVSEAYHGYDMDSKGDRINRHKLKRAFLMLLLWKSSFLCVLFKAFFQKDASSIKNIVASSKESFQHIDFVMSWFAFWLIFHTKMLFRFKIRKYLSSYTVDNRQRMELKMLFNTNLIEKKHMNIKMKTSLILLAATLSQNISTT